MVQDFRVENGQDFVEGIDLGFTDLSLGNSHLSSIQESGERGLDSVTVLLL